MLIIEILRGTDRYHKFKAFSSAKQDLYALKKPQIRRLKNAGVLTQMAVMTLLLKRISLFIVTVTLP